MLELIIEDGAMSPDVELRDVNGNICARGGVSSVSDFLSEAYRVYLKTKSEDSNKSDS